MMSGRYLGCPGGGISDCLRLGGVADAILDSPGGGTGLGLRG